MIRLPCHSHISTLLALSFAFSASVLGEREFPLEGARGSATPTGMMAPSEDSFVIMRGVDDVLSRR